MNKLNWSFLLLFAGSAHAALLQESEAMAFPNDLNCVVVGEVDEDEGRALLPDVLERVGSRWKSDDFAYISKIDGVGSHHLLFNLLHENVPVDKQELILSVDDKCQLFRYQYRVVDAELTARDYSVSKIKTKDDAVNAVKALLSQDDNTLITALKIQASRLKLINKVDHSLLEPSFIADEVTSKPLYRLMPDNSLELGFQLNLPSRNPDGALELWWGTLHAGPGGSQRFPYAKRTDKDAVPAMSSWNWRSYGQHPKRTLSADYKQNFWEILPPRLQSIVINSDGNLRTKNVVYLDSEAFPWSYESASFQEQWDKADVDEKYTLSTILTNLDYADKGVNHASNVLGYSNLFPAKPGLVLSKLGSGWSSVYKPGFDIIQINNNGCPASMYDAGAVLHEQGHSVFVRLQALGRSSSVNTAMNEGFADYWAGGFLRQDQNWNGVLAEFRNDVCTSKGADRQILEPLYDYFDGLELQINGSHGGVNGPEGKVFFEPMLAQPLLASMEELIKLHGQDDGRKLADHIVLETFAGLSVDAHYRELAQAIVVSARRLDAAGKAEDIYRRNLTNSNLLPRQVEPESRVALVPVMSSEAKVTLVNHSTADKADSVTVGFPGQMTKNIEVAANGQRAITLPTPQMTCGVASSQPLTLEHTQDGQLLQHKAYPFTLIGGLQSNSQAFEKEGNKWFLNIADTLAWSGNNTHHVFLLKSDNVITSAPKLNLGAETFTLNQLALTGNTQWLTLTHNSELTVGKWQLMTSHDYKSAELLTLDCVPAFTIDGPLNVTENSSVTLQAMMNGNPIAVKWKLAGGTQQSSGESFILDIPNLAEPIRYDVEASFTFDGNTRTVRHQLVVDAVNQPATFELKTPTEVNEGETATFSIEQLIDPDSEGYLSVEWYVDNQKVGQGNSIQWHAPATDTDKTVTVSVHVRDNRELAQQAVIKTAQVSLKHINAAPTISLNAPAEVQAGKLLSVTAMVNDKETATDKLSVRWTISGVDAPVLPQGKTLSWTIPSTVPASSITLTAEVSDGEATKTSSRVIRIKPANKAPVVTLSGGDNVQSGQSVEILANLQDETPEQVTLNWQVTGSVNGKALTFEKLSKEKIRISLPRTAVAGSAQINVTANDGEASSVATRTLTWRAYTNSSPTVSINGPLMVNVGEQVTLIGNVTDTDNWPSALTHSWRQVSGPKVVLKHTGTKLTFMVPETASDSKLVFELDAFDGVAHSKKQWQVQVTKFVIPSPVIKFKNSVPAEMNELSQLVIDASNSTGTGRAPLNYSWRQLSGPALSGLPYKGVKLSTNLPEVDAPVDVELELTVTEQDRENRKVIRVRVADLGPAPMPVKPQQKTAGARFSLAADEIASLKAGVDYQFNWEQVKGPEVTITAPHARTLNVDLPAWTKDEELGFDLTVATHGNEYKYPVILKVAAAPKVATPVKPQGTSGSDGGGSGGSVNLFGLLALFAGMMLRSRKRSGL
ncbi:hypothetical protein [Photobacterium sp. J15]|uniref:hypothetical protein n=1 Tax=Photobacterium sp. J15 TaxID=265901 RepID=UPI0007E30F74|nr:hypothetical protein [Photobacterium sp. J15]